MNLNPGNEIYEYFHKNDYRKANQWVLGPGEIIDAEIP